MKWSLVLLPFSLGSHIFVLVNIFKSKLFQSIEWHRCNNNTNNNNSNENNRIIIVMIYSKLIYTYNLYKNHVL